MAKKIVKVQHAKNNSFTVPLVRKIYHGQNAKSRVVSALHLNKAGLSLTEVMAATGVEEATVKRNLSRLVSEGIAKKKVVRSKTSVVSYWVIA